MKADSKKDLSLNPNSALLANYVERPEGAQVFQGGTTQCQRGAAPVNLVWLEHCYLPTCLPYLTISFGYSFLLFAEYKMCIFKEGFWKTKFGLSCVEEKRKMEECLLAV